jgi:hypothetical protein
MEVPKEAGNKDPAKLPSIGAKTGSMRLSPLGYVATIPKHIGFGYR